MKLAVTGKGGVGKTTITVLLARALQEIGKQVTVIDADPNTNLAAAMGCPNADKISPLIELKDLIEERTGARPGSTGGMFRLNPFVEDIPARYAVDAGGVKVLVSGGLKQAGSGCYCPENALVRALVAHLLLDADTALILDMEAGIEHLSRATVRAVNCLLIVVDPGRRSVDTALRIARLAGDLGVSRIGAIGNKIRTPAERAQLVQALPDIGFVGFLPYDEDIYRAESAGQPVSATGSALKQAVRDIVTLLGTVQGE